MNPVILYLDTHDVVDFCSGKNLDVYNKICEYVYSGNLIVPNSFPLMLELIQNFKEEYYESRLERAKVLKKLTNGWSFYHILTNDENHGLNRDGMWCDFSKLPRIYEYKKNLKNINCPEEFICFLRKSPDFINGFSSFSRDQVDEICSMVECFEEKSLEAKKKYDELKRSIKIDKKSLIREGSLDDAQSKKDNFKKMMNVEFLIDCVFSNTKVCNKGFIEGLKACCKGYAKNKSKEVKKSDMADLMHASFIEHCHLWRGDKDFSDCLIRNGHPHSDRIVKKIGDVVSRVEFLLGQGKG